MPTQDAKTIFMGMMQQLGAVPQSGAPVGNTTVVVIGEHDIIDAYSENAWR